MEKEYVTLKVFGINKPKFTDDKCILTVYKGSAKGERIDDKIKVYYTFLKSDAEIKMYNRYPTGYHSISVNASDYEMCKFTLNIIRSYYVRAIVKNSDKAKTNYYAKYISKVQSLEKALRLFDVASKELLKQYERG